MVVERQRLKEQSNNTHWKKWGPYLAERQWGTVREDYSVYGDAWNFVPHDHARSRTYRWGEDGIGGISDNQQNICLAFSFWNGNDAILKERYFGLTGNEGNHGEDLKEIYYYLDSTPTHSYMKMLYKYPIKAFPYSKITETTKTLNRKDPEFELLDTNIFKDNAYFDIFIEYAKSNAEDVLVKITAHNRSNKAAPLHILPTITLRNTWAYKKEMPAEKPNMQASGLQTINIKHPAVGNYYVHFNDPKELLFCENETNNRRIFDRENQTEFVKDGINNYVVNGINKGVNPKKRGTKAAAWFNKIVPANDKIEITLRLNTEANQDFYDFNDILSQRLNDADHFYESIQQDITSKEQREIQRQAFAGMMWNKQFYYYNLNEWHEGDARMPFEFHGRNFQRNHQWKHASMRNILSMPDKWEYPWFAAWDLAFHCLTLARLDPVFAKRQLEVVLREYYMHPNGQIPAYEWNFSDVNPPVHAWATWKVYEIDKKNNGGIGDIDFLEKVFHKLLLNFTWWVNQKDEEGNNIFGGGFLGLDNIGVFDRNANIPGFNLQQADATGWMAIYTLNMMRIACEISLHNPVYQDMASKFFEHFLQIASAINSPAGSDEEGLWDEEDQFYYDKVNNPFGQTVFMKVRSLVGLIPLCAVEVLDHELLSKLPVFKRRIEWIMANRPDLASMISKWEVPGKGETHLFSLLRGNRMKKVLTRLFDESEFLSDYGIRSLSKYHKEHPFTFNLHGDNLTVAYSPAESELSIMGGNSNWRGPIWFPLNYLIIDSLHKYASYYGDDYEVEYPNGSGNIMSIDKAAKLISARLVSIFEENKKGKIPSLAERDRFTTDPNFKKYSLFYEYFHGDLGYGLGAAHQTGWTGLVADLIDEINKK